MLVIFLCWLFIFFMLVIYLCMLRRAQIEEASELAERTADALATSLAKADALEAEASYHRQQLASLEERCRAAESDDITKRLPAIKRMLGLDNVSVLEFSEMFYRN